MPRPSVAGPGVMGLPFKPGDWASDEVDRIARVKAVYQSDGEVLFDLVMFDRGGERLGRVSPAMGGPSSFEPACSINGWRRIRKPSFPVSLRWLPGADGKKVGRYWAGDSLPPADWTPKKRRAARVRAIPDGRFERALRAIADGHNNARQLAKDVLKGAARI